MFGQLAPVTDEAIENYILEMLREQPIVVDSDTELSTHLTMFGVSNKQMLRRLGSMIKRKLVLRCRREMQYRGDDDRPITIKLYPKTSA